MLGGYGGWVSLGTASANPVYQNGFIPQDEIPVRLRKREGIEAMRPDTLRIAELEAVHVGCFIAFENVQFVDGELGSAWCDSDADSDRHLVDERGDTLLGPHQPLRTFRNPSVAGGERLFRRDFGLVQQKLPVAGYRCAERP